MRASNSTLFPKIISEGYCCLHGYLGLCKARGEKKPEMAAWIGVCKRTIFYNYELMEKGKRPCMKQHDCMLPLIQEIQASETPPGSEPPASE